MAETLPPELIPLILSHLRPDQNVYPPIYSKTLRKLTTVSRQWQYAAELTHDAFSVLRVRSTELDKFEEIMQTRHRRRFLKRLEYEIVLPSYPRKQRLAFETREEGRRNDEAFTEGICALWRVLKGWEEEEERMGWEVRAGLELRLRAAAKEDLRKLNSDGGMVGARWRHVYLRCSRDVLRELPKLKSVVGFVSSREDRDPYPDDDERDYVRLNEGWTVAKLAGKFPNLERLNLTVQEGNLQLYPKRFRRHRTELAKALLEEYRNWPNLKEFEIGAITEIPTDPGFICPVLHDPRNGPDHLTHALQHILHIPTLKRFRCKPVMVLSPTIFDDPPLGCCNLPGNTEESPRNQPDHPPPFLHLEEIDVLLSSVTPAGTNYFSDQPLSSHFSGPIPNYTDFSHLYALYDKVSEENTIRKESAVGSDTDGDDYPYPPTQNKAYTKAWEHSLGLKPELWQPTDRSNANTEAIAILFRGFISLVKKAPKIHDLSMATAGVGFFLAPRGPDDLDTGVPTLEWYLRQTRCSRSLVPLFMELRDDMARIGSLNGEPTTKVTSNCKELEAVWPNCRIDAGCPVSPIRRVIPDS